MLDETKSNQNPPGGGSNIPELEKFIFKSDRFTNEVVPRRLEPARVAKFLIDRIEENDGVRVFVQVEKAAVFYDAHEAAAKFRTFLKGNESGEDAVLRSIVITRTIARIGNADEIQFAVQYYKALVGKADSSVEFDALILLHEALNLGLDSASLRQRLNAKMTALEAKQATNDQARLQFLDLEENVAGKLERAEKVQALKDKITKTADRKQRIEEEIKAYLAIGYGYIEFLEPWAAARLRRETWGEQPEVQTVRGEKPALKDDLVKTLNAFTGKLDGFSTLDDEEKESSKVRLLRAIKFFGGTVSEDEESLLRQFKGTQADTLANEGFLLD